ncbi:hypothetical protein [Salipiger thiooxidans]|uniref:hypothetical protein n=1 Tax=Salipiger thiooxidans TaxID=282683 RepID=UPI001CFB1EF1|nr:hypothetical protein [Salipiger thiooxidans]
MTLQGPFKIKRIDGWHVVVDGRDNIVSAPRSSYAQSTELVDELTKRARQKKRNCMCCGGFFMSEGPHNRLCNPCRARGTSLPPEAANPSRN